jgi:site-specific DNA recombinase
VRGAATGKALRLSVVIYARASKDGKGRKISVASQVAQGRKWCTQVGATVVAVLVDNDLSASRYATEARGDYEEALRLLATGAANCLWTWENSRAQRELDVFVRLRKILVEVGGFWAYDDRLYDMHDPDDRVDTAEDAVDAERESEKLRKRVLRGVEARDGRALGWAAVLWIPDLLRPAYRRGGP